MYNPIVYRKGVTYDVRSFGSYANNQRVHIVNVSVQPQRNTFSSSNYIDIKSIDAGYLGAGFFMNANSSGKSNLSWSYSGPSDYRTPTLNAINTWSSQTNVNLTEVPNNVPTDIPITVADYGTFNSDIGRTTICTPYTCVNGTSSIEDQYTRAYVQINRYYLEGSDAVERESIILHELGHALSLAHRFDRGVSNLGVMREDIKGKRITTLNPNDIALVNSRYP